MAGKRNGGRENGRREWKGVKGKKEIRIPHPIYYKLWWFRRQEERPDITGKNDERCRICEVQQGGEFSEAA